jgi:hypothetical protein
VQSRAERRIGNAAIAITSVLLFVCAATVRVAYIRYKTPALLEKNQSLSYDEAEYSDLAAQISSGQFSYIQRLPYQAVRSVPTGLPTAFRTPGFPVLLGLIYSLAGVDCSRARVILTLLTSLIAPLLFLLYLYLFGKAVPAVLCGLCWAFWPTSVIMSGWLYGEEMATLLVVVSALTTAIAARRKSVPLAIVAGIVVGAAILVRGFLIFIPLAFGAWLLSTRKQGLAVALIAGCTALPGAWVVRNMVALGLPSLSSETTEVLWLGNNAWARGSWPHDTWEAQHKYLLEKTPNFDSLDDLGVYHVFGRETLADLRNHPGHILWLLPRKAVIFFGPKSWLGIDWVFALLLPFFALGIGILWKQQSRSLLLLLTGPIASSLIVCLLGFPDIRYRHVTDPMFLLLGAIGLRAIPITRLRRREHAI